MNNNLELNVNEKNKSAIQPNKFFDNPTVKELRTISSFSSRFYYNPYQHILTTYIRIPDEVLKIVDKHFKKKQSNQSISKLFKNSDFYIRYKQYNQLTKQLRQFLTFSETHQNHVYGVIN